MLNQMSMRALFFFFNVISEGTNTLEDCSSTWLQPQPCLDLLKVPTDPGKHPQTCTVTWLCPKNRVVLSLI